MNKQSTTNTFGKPSPAFPTARMLRVFDSAGLSLPEANFFGITLGKPKHQQQASQRSVSPVNALLQAFDAAGLTRSETSFFGVALSEYAHRQGTTESISMQRLAFVLPKRQRVNQLRAA